MKHHKYIALQIISIVLSFGVLFSCFVMNKRQQYNNDLQFLISDYKKDFDKYKFYNSDKCEALLIYTKSTIKDRDVIIQNVPLQNFYVYLNTQDTSSSTIFGILNKLPIFFISDSKLKYSLNEIIEFDTVLVKRENKDLEKKQNIEYSITPMEYEPVLISTYHLNSFTKRIKLQNDSILNLKIKRKHSFKL